MVDDLDGDTAGGGFGEGAGGVAVEGGPGVGVNLGLERCLECLVGVVGAEEVGVADEEALLVVVGIDEPAGDAVGAVAAHLAGVGVEDINSVDAHPDILVPVFQDVDIGLAKDDKEVALAGVLEVASHVQVGVHARLEHRDAAELLELGGMGVIAESTGDEHIESGIGGLACGDDKIRPRHGAEFGADEDTGAPCGDVLAAFPIAALGADIAAGPGCERGEGDAILLMRLLDAGRPEILQDHVGEVRRLAVADLPVEQPGDRVVILVHRQHPVRRQALDGEGAGDADADLST